MNVALLFGLFKALFSRDGGTWNRIERASVRAYPHASLQAGEYPN
jgi:hypothetical protein